MEIVMHYDTNIKLFDRRYTRTRSIEDLTELALSELMKFKEADLLFAPNNHRTSDIYEALRIEGFAIFDHLAYMERIHFFTDDLMSQNPENEQAVYIDVLEQFYCPLFRTGIIKKAWFFEGWNYEADNHWLRRQSLRFQLRIHDFPRILLNDI